MEHNRVRTGRVRAHNVWREEIGKSLTHLEHPVHREDYGTGIERVTVVESYSLSEIERVRQTIRSIGPRSCEVGLKPSARSWKDKGVV